MFGFGASGAPLPRHRRPPVGYGPASARRSPCSHEVVSRVTCTDGRRKGTRGDPTSGRGHGEAAENAIRYSAETEEVRCDMDEVLRTPLDTDDVVQCEARDGGAVPVFSHSPTKEIIIIIPLH